MASGRSVVPGVPGQTHPGGSSLFEFAALRVDDGLQLVGVPRFHLVADRMEVRFLIAQIDQRFALGYAFANLVE